MLSLTVIKVTEVQKDLQYVLELRNAEGVDYVHYLEYNPGLQVGQVINIDVSEPIFPLPVEAPNVSKLDQILALLTQVKIPATITSITTYANGDQRLTVRCAPNSFVKGDIQILKP